VQFAISMTVDATTTTHEGSESVTYISGAILDTSKLVVVIQAAGEHRALIYSSPCDRSPMSNIEEG
jgi:hypothetical protein